jgi:hypothetical protein
MDLSIRRVGVGRRFAFAAKARAIERRQLSVIAWKSVGRKECGVETEIEKDRKNGKDVASLKGLWQLTG